MGNWVHDMSTSNLVIQLQRLAKKVSYHDPGTRAALLEEAASRLTAYRQAERAKEQEATHG